MIQTDLWRVGIVKAPMAAIIAAGSLDGFEMLWLPAEGPLRFMADPFGLWKDGLLHIFVETYDYRTRHGTIDVLILDEKLNLLARKPALRGTLAPVLSVRLRSGWSHMVAARSL